MKDERIYQALAGENDAEELAQLGEFLSHAPRPSVNLQHQAQLLDLMRTHLPAPKSRLEQISEWYPLAVLLAQARIIRSEIWLASALVLLLGLFVTLFQPSQAALSFSALAPMVAAVGVALLYDDDIRLILELEESTRSSARLLLLARLTLVFSFNLLLALLGSVILALLNVQIQLIPLILSWLAPMAFLSAFAFFLSILLADTLAATAFSLFLWFMHIFFRSAADTSAWQTLLSLPGLADPSNRPLLFGTAACLVLVALWLVDFDKSSLGKSE